MKIMNIIIRHLKTHMKQLYIYILYTLYDTVPIALILLSCRSAFLKAPTAHPGRPALKVSGGPMGFFLKQPARTAAGSGGNETLWTLSVATRPFGRETKNWELRC